MLPATSRGRRWAGGYLLLVVAVTAFVALSVAILHDPDDGANMSGVWLILVTLPWSMVGLGGSGDIPWWRVMASLLLGAAATLPLLGRSTAPSAVRFE